ncbi:hypothetical protein ARMGADRAFT_1039503 [Armillaria gallica]|uniref:Uncharacterized protein n=1 Tax=Armillaria gallica TaxID=47427 RepID=A0A2H3CH88_ARMGA|nr:hypothetical protein ARMGADRAFT_1039503 [Armillaria gallica]
MLKAYNPDSLNVLLTFRFHGEALASAADLCYLEISSTWMAMLRETWSVILKLPVQRHSHPSLGWTLEPIKQEIETYVLVFPGVAFLLKNTNVVRNSGPVVKVLRLIGSPLPVTVLSATSMAKRHIIMPASSYPKPTVPPS